MKIELLNKEIILSINLKTWVNIMKIIKATNKEICMLLEVTKEKTNNLIYSVHNYYIPKQKMQSAHVVSDASSEASMLYEAEKAGLDIDNLKGFLHSHVQMGAFASGQDRQTFVKLYEASPTFYVSIIVNQKEEIFTMIADKEEGLYIENPTLKITYPEDFLTEEQASVIVKEAEIVEETFSYKHDDQWDLFGHRKDIQSRIVTVKETDNAYRKQLMIKLFELEQETHINSEKDFKKFNAMYKNHDIDDLLEEIEVIESIQQEDSKVDPYSYLNEEAI